MSFVALFSTLFLSVNAHADTTFLTPAEAFVVQVDDNKRDVTWTIAEGYYLYEAQVKVSLTTPALSDSQTALPFEFTTTPEIKDDPNFGRVKVFHQTMGIRIAPLIELTNGNTNDKTSDIKVTYQGCAEAGLCYPPQTITISSADSIPSADSISSAGTAFQSSGEEGKLVELLLNGNRIWVLLTFFVLGLGLTFTPCVLPMIPILAGIIVGQAGTITTKKGFFLSLSYVLGMSVSYSAAGVLVGVFGAQLNLQALFQTPVVIVIFSLLFVLLSLSMFGFYELQLPVFLRDRLDRLSQKSVGGPYIGVGIMGAISALIVSPCVSAPLAGALIYISTTGDAVLGGSILFVMSLGMGVPLLLVGLGGGKYLPKAGMWMMQVKAAFGVVLLGVAIALLSRIVADTISVLLWATLCVLYAVYLSPFQSTETGGSKIRQGAALMLLFYGLSLLSSSLAGQASLTTPLAYLNSSVASASKENNGPLFNRTADVDTLKRALSQAKLEGKTVVVDIYADWCTSCLEMEEQVFARRELQPYRNTTVFLQLDITDNTPTQQDFLGNYGIFGPPTVLFFSKHGEVVALRQGALDFPTFQQLVDSALMVP
ncbi:protein-disulfide reductase DsbD [Marinomonas sp. A79]|uniref:Protein-disulfide reductase DsbD n=2 Tax=Marinomonas vulgaris TaxID=2823372 RepID=A0ABS5HF98_9GAMM|nr:protein-disulfide reductase DsbD [Marinomonas vulgaris]